MELEVVGTILGPMPNEMFRVQLKDGQTVLCQMAGRTRLHAVRVIPGDRVNIKLSPFDQSRGKITSRVE